MSITSEINRINTNIANAYTSISNKGGTLPETQNSANLADAIDSISTGGGGSTGEKNVKFYDYDGSLVTSYTKDEFLELTQMPANPSHSGLVAQGWNWSLQNAKNYLLSGDEYDSINIGQMYTPSSGLSEFDIEINANTGLSVKLKLDGTKNWGDGTSDTETTHTYADYGKYTITCDGTTMTTSSSSGLFGQYNTSVNYYVTNVRFASTVTISSYALQYCYSLTNVILPLNATSVSNYAFATCYALSFIIIPNGITNLGDYCFNSCFYLNCVVMSNTIKSLGNSAFKFDYNLKEVLLPNSLQTIGTYLFYFCTSLKKVILSKNISRIESSMFRGCQSLTNIIIPNGVYNLNTSAFQDCYLLSNITIPDTVTNVGTNLFQNCYSLVNIKPSINSSLSSYMFFYCYNIIKYDFSSCNKIPTLSNTSAFDGINPIAKIVVPDDLYDSWITASVWTNFANYIVKASDYVE